MRFLCFFVVLGGCACAVRAEDPSLEMLERLTRQVVELRSQVAAEDRGWREQKRDWTRELDLLDREQKMLSEQLSRAKRSMQDIDAKIASATQDKAALHHIQEQLKPVAETIEQHLVSMLPFISESVAPDLHASISRLRDQKDAEKDVRITVRLQKAISLMTDIENLQHELRVGREMVAVGEERREMDVLYVGTAMAYAVSRDNAVAMAGIPKPEGWCWRLCDYPAEIRNAMEIMERHAPASFVKVPVIVQPMEGGIHE